MPKRQDSILNLLILAPWWVSVILAALTYFILTVTLPARFGSDSPFNQLVLAVASWAWIPAGVFLLTGVFSFILSRKKKALLENQTSLESLQTLSWKEFEWMIGEAYRRQGYSVEESLRGGPDGGIDLVLRRNGRLSLVQCKRWKTYSVGAPVVRELYGILVAEKADEAIVVTSGKFTQEAVGFAQGKPIKLVDGPALLDLVSGVQRKTSVVAVTSPQKTKTLPICPKCGSPMVERVAKRGKNAGSPFYGCSQYPKCNGTLAQAE